VEPGTFAIKQGIVLLWAFWLSTIVVLNVLDGLKGAGILPQGFKLSSTNFTSMLKLTAVYSTPRWLVWILYAGAVVWEALAAFLLWRALSSGLNLGAVNLAFLVSLALWGMFIWMDEIFLTFVVEGQGGYSTSAAHRSIFTAFLVSLIALYVLPN